MIDFNNNAIVKLGRIDPASIEGKVAPLLVAGESIISAYKAMRDFVVFTDKRIISVNVQGITGKKQDFSSLPYKKVQAFSVETSGTFDIDSELELYFSALGKVVFEFSGSNNIIQIGQLISSYIL